MIKIRFAGAGMAALLLVAGTQAFAGSAVTDAYQAGVRQNIDVLTQSSEIAADKAAGDAVKAYAKNELGTGEIVASTTTDTATPTIVASNMAGDMSEGRSVAKDDVVDPTVFQAPLGTGVTMPTGEIGLKYLASTSGKEFDWTYKALQLDVLTTLHGYYEAYSQTGDDPGLRADAIGNLPKVDARLAELKSL